MTVESGLGSLPEYKTRTYVILKGTDSSGGPRPFLSVGILAEKYENHMGVLLWQVGALFLCFLMRGID